MQYLFSHSLYIKNNVDFLAVQIGKEDDKIYLSFLLELLVCTGLKDGL